MATKEEVEFLYDLERLLISRRINKPKGSYSTKLFKKGIDKIAQKLGEEAVETIIAAKNKKNAELIGETADLIYHMLVLLVETLKKANSFSFSILSHISICDCGCPSFLYAQVSGDFSCSPLFPVYLYSSSLCLSYFFLQNRP